MRDLLFNNTLDALIANGDFVTGESTEQHQYLLLASNKGDFKENPAICVGLAGWLKDDNPADVLGEVKQEFEKDGMVVNRLTLLNDKLTTDAHY